MTEIDIGIENMNRQQIDYVKVLAEVIRLLSDGYVTVSDVAAEMGCSWEGASRRIQALEERGCKVLNHRSEHGVPGAPPRGYRIVPNAASRKILDIAKRVT